MKRHGNSLRAFFACALFVAFAPASHAQRSVSQDASLTLNLLADHFQDHGLRLETIDPSPQVLSGEVEFLISDSTPVTLLDKYGSKILNPGPFQIVPAVRVVSGDAQVQVSGLVWVNDSPSGEASSLRSATEIADEPVLELRGFRTDGLVAAAESVIISTGLAKRLGNPDLAGLSFGVARLNSFDGNVRGDEGNESMVPETSTNSIVAGSSEGGVATTTGPDMTFCQLYGMQQFGRVGDIVGLSAGTTSWNIGNRDMIWIQNPDNRHPMITWNLYRLKNDRFEQIGMSHVKHGFFALGNTQCGGSCTYEPGHSQGNWLGQNCTDTYDPQLNASQNGLGPRYEINAWTGGFTFAGSHLSAGSHSHSAIQHRCQVRDADLVPAQNAGATYFAEGQYITIDDINPVNSIAHKSTTVSGVAGGTFSFGMSGPGTPPVSGPAINSWPGATLTTIAQEVPVVRFISPDGRCILASKPMDLGGGQWHYEYALYNLDMHRKAKSFNIPLPQEATVTNVGFSAVQSHNEPFSNTPWTPVIDSAGITWSTTDNPIRWGMTYNFRFDADAPPGNVTATIGLYEPGDPTSLSGSTPGPFIANPAPNLQVDPSGIQKCRFISTIVPPAVVASGQQTALRVVLTSLHHVNPPYTGGAAAEFTEHEGSIRWVGPPTQYAESSSDPTMFHAATLQCMPYYQDWSTVGVLHITGPDIVPSSVYTLQNVSVNCQGIEPTCTEVSSLLEVATNRWADVVAPFNPPAITAQPDLGDIAALVAKFRSAAGAPIKAQALLAGDMPDLVGDIDFTQIAALVDAFRGAPYPNGGPVACP
jgi:hypothetical protein